MAKRTSARRTSASGTGGRPSAGRSSPKTLPFRDAVAALLDWLERAGLCGVVIGGVAVSLLGRARLTRDLDALAVSLADRDDWPLLLGTASACGLISRRTDAIRFAQRTRMLLFTHAASGIDVDVSVGLLPFEHEIVTRATVTPISGLNVPLPRPDDLIVLKAIAHRPHDLADIDTLLSVHPRVNRRRIRGIVRSFAEVLDAPEIIGDLERLLRRRR